MKIEIYADKPEHFLTNIANQFNIKVENDTLYLPEKYGKGYIKQINFSKGLALTYYELVLHNSITIIRKKSENDKILPIIFWTSNSGINQEINLEKKLVGLDSPYGIFAPSNNIETTYTFPANVLIKNITVTINTDWLLDNLSSENDYINKCILQKKSYFIFEEITSQMLEIIKSIDDTLNNQCYKTLSKIYLHSKTLELLTQFLDKLVKRPFNTQTVNINPVDVDNIFKVKGLIMSNFVNIPNTSFLAKEATMNERKMQKCFKQIFGESIYQYALSIKMKEAQKLLETKKYSVSEVGYKVGYSNLSHFTEKFKKHFSINPKAFISSL
ncbi:MAG: helix-turn-helix transcriptional regulator [Bacteroidales bacterium]|nr:helix-turn-helix transcriptional regulator [Bacteroidales bacterium]